MSDLWNKETEQLSHGFSRGLNHGATLPRHVGLCLNRQDLTQSSGPEALA